MAKEKVSILMNCYNGAKYLREALDSVVAQTYPNWELVFIDNWSTDDSVALVESYQDARMKVYKTPTHCPLGEAREFGMGMCDGDYVAFLDTDDVWMAEKLERQVASLRENPECGLVYGSYSVINGSGKKTKTRILEAVQGNLLGRNLANYEVNFQSALVSREALENVGRPYFWANLSFSPDYNLIMRLLVNTGGVCLAAVLVSYRITGNSLTKKSTCRWAVEMQQTLDQVVGDDRASGLFSEVDLLQARAKIAYYRAVAAMETGNKLEAQKFLYAFRQSGWRYRILYWAAVSQLSWRLLHKCKG